MKIVHEIGVVAFTVLVVLLYGLVFSYLITGCAMATYPHVQCVKINEYINQCTSIYQGQTTVYRIYRQ